MSAVVQLAEQRDSKSVCCEFESHLTRQNRKVKSTGDENCLENSRAFTGL